MRRTLLCAALLAAFAATPLAEARITQAGLDRGVPAPEGGTLPAPAELTACSPRHRHHHTDHDQDDDRDHHDHDD